jgi:SAM-dependent methyltransferase
MSIKVKKCIICDNKKFRSLYGELIQCESCGLVVASEIPTEKEIQKLYQQEYFFGMEYSDYKADRPALEANFKKRIKRLEKSIHKDATVVELGSAYGYFLNLIKENVKSHIGFEISKDGVNYSVNELSVKAVNDDFMKHKIDTKSVDLVVMWDVVEHLTEPDIYIEKASKILKKGGKLVLTTGDIERLIPKIRKNKWRMIHPPTHIYYFSATTLSRLLDKYGFKIDYVKYPAVSRNTGSVIKQISVNQKAAGKSGKLLDQAHNVAVKTGLHNLNIPLNTFDVMEILATKK